MDNASVPYREDFLHWIWETLRFDLPELQTISGERIDVVDPGELNRSDGPDFKEAQMQIGGMRWFGDVEFHWSASDWYHHGHHLDPNYNRVILHVVYHRSDHMTVHRQDMTSPYTLHFRPYLPDNLRRLTARFHRQDRLPCSGQLQYISEDAMNRQIARAEREYFESKTDQLLQYYDPDLPPATAWKHLLVLALFDGLGISKNRDPMVALGRRLLSEEHRADDLGTLQIRARQLAGFDNNGKGAVSGWNRKACRPNNQPDLRVCQAVELMWQILPTAWSNWMGNDPRRCWERLITAVKTEPGIGRSRSDTLFGVVFLPSLYLLGSLFHSKKLKRTAYNQWKKLKPEIPDSLFKLFETAGFPSRIYRSRLGAIYQLKRYCKPRQCQRCEVLKEAISS